MAVRRAWERGGAYGGETDGIRESERERWRTAPAGLASCGGVEEAAVLDEQRASPHKDGAAIEGRRVAQRAPATREGLCSWRLRMIPPEGMSAGYPSSQIVPPCDAIAPPCASVPPPSAPPRILKSARALRAIVCPAAAIHAPR